MHGVPDLSSLNTTDQEFINSYSNPEMGLLHRVAEIYDQKQIAEILGKASPGRWTRETINRALKGKASPRFSYTEYQALESVLPKRPVHYDNPKFRFVDLFAGIGGIRKGFDAVGGKCVFTSEWDANARRTYLANHYCDMVEHTFNHDIRDVTLSQHAEITEEQAYAHIQQVVPDHEVLLAGFPCQPFSVAGVSKKNSLGRKHA